MLFFVWKASQQFGMRRKNLQDHMIDLELFFSMSGEAARKEIAVTCEARGFDENKTGKRNETH